MFHKILVAVHRSDAIGQQVFQQALDLAKLTGATLKLVYVLSVDEDHSPGLMAMINTPENKKLWDEFERPGIEMLRSYVEQATAAGISTEIYRGLGRPQHVICETAKAWNADLILIGRRGLSGLGELIMGSVSNYVTHYAPCSVLVVQAPSGDPATAVADRQTAAVR